jgi:hypothetical protein
MKRLQRYCLLLGWLLLPGSAWSGMAEHIADAARDLEAQVVAWRRDIHQHPELSNREFRTAALVAEHLRGLGLEVTTGVAHTGVVGLLRGGRAGPVVALRADMDALPVHRAALRLHGTGRLQWPGRGRDARLRARYPRGDSHGRGAGARRHA